MTPNAINPYQVTFVGHHNAAAVGLEVHHLQSVLFRQALTRQHHHDPHLSLGPGPRGVGVPTQHLCLQPGLQDRRRNHLQGGLEAGLRVYARLVPRVLVLVLPPCLLLPLELRPGLFQMPLP